MKYIYAIIGVIILVGVGCMLTVVIGNLNSPPAASDFGITVGIPQKNTPKPGVTAENYMRLFDQLHKPGGVARAEVEDVLGRPAAPDATRFARGRVLAGFNTTTSGRVHSRGELWQSEDLWIWVDFDENGRVRGMGADDPRDYPPLRR